MMSLLCMQATVNMFYFQRQQTEPVPLSYHNLEMTCRSLEPGEPYLLYILGKRRPEHRLQVFAFQEYIPQYKGYVNCLAGHLCCIFNSGKVYVGVSENKIT